MITNDTTLDCLPKQFLEKLPHIYPATVYAQIYESFTLVKPKTFRVNTLKTTIEEVKKTLEAFGIPYQLVAWYPNAFIIDTVYASFLEKTSLILNGAIYIQKLSSMIPSLVLNPTSHDIVCDLTAAPGSKTTQLATLMNNNGIIIANDVSKSRGFKLRANLLQQGVTNTKCINIPGQYLWKKYPEYFDKILVDVPCSLEGQFSCLDPKTYKDWKPGKIKFLSQLQKFLLRSAISATRPGGIIVYSTCTLEPEENEEVIEWVLEKEKSNIEVVPIDIPIQELVPAMTKWKNKSFHPSIALTKRIIPSKVMEGFYIAKIRKISSTVSLY